MHKIAKNGQKWPKMGYKKGYKKVIKKTPKMTPKLNPKFLNITSYGKPG